MLVCHFERSEEFFFALNRQLPGFFAEFTLSEAESPRTTTRKTLLETGEDGAQAAGAKTT